MLMSKWKTATFSRIDLPKENSRFNVAFYVVDGEEVRNIFPDEGILKDKLYRSDKEYRVLYNKRINKVFDRFSIATCIVGFVFGVLGGIFILFGVVL